MNHGKEKGNQRKASGSEDEAFRGNPLEAFCLNLFFVVLWFSGFQGGFGLFWLFLWVLKGLGHVAEVFHLGAPSIPVGEVDQII